MLIFQHLCCGFFSTHYSSIMNRLEKGELSRRERQLLDILYRLGEATAKDVQDELPDTPSY